MEKVWGCYYCDSPAHKSPACPYVKRHPEQQQAAPDSEVPPTLAPRLSPLAQSAAMDDQIWRAAQQQAANWLDGYAQMMSSRHQAAAQQAQLAQTLRQQVGQKGRP